MPESVQKVTKGPSHLRRRSLPALHLQEDQSAAMMSNPPVFTNPLRRRGCCDHQHTEQVRGGWQCSVTVVYLKDVQSLLSAWRKGASTFFCNMPPLAYREVQTKAQ
jgi:hypothetical protein